MPRERLFAACAVVVGTLIVSVATVQAAPVLPAQEPSPIASSDASDISPTFPSGRLGTFTPLPPGTRSPELHPTPTLQPPPSGGGRVAVEALYVRDAPGFSANVVGIIPYNQSIYPVGRNSDTTWIAVNWSSGHGWVYGGMVGWAPDVDLKSLPVLAEETGEPLSPTPGESAIPSETESASPTATPSPRPTPAPSAAATTEQISATSTAAAPATSTPAAALAPPPGSSRDELPQSARLPLFGGLGVLLLAGALYGWRWFAGRAEVKRYANGFVLSTCPVCQEGHVHLDELVRTSLGIRWVRRSARCDVCRSVLREVRPGVWRYSVDAFVNPEMAERFKNQRATTADLQELARNIVLKPSTMAHDEPTAQSLNLDWLEIEDGAADDASASPGLPGDEDKPQDE